VLVLLSLATAARAAEETAASDPVAARVNGTEIRTELLDRTFATYLEQQRVAAPALGKIAVYRALRTQILDTLIGQELLWQYAESKGIVAADEDVVKTLDQVKGGLSPEAYQHRLLQVGMTEESYRDDLKHRISVQEMVKAEITPKIEVTDEEIHEFYAANPDSFARPEEARLRHILVRVDQGADAETKERARKSAEAIMAEAKQEGADFAALAKEYSQDTSASQGGDLGFVQADALVKPFSDAGFALQPGEVSDVVETQFGYHIIKLEERRGGDVVSEEDAKDRIRQFLSNQKSQQAVADLIAKLREQGDVEVVESL
jgi:peptidyl-prolyl cis-trans isomerase C